jgi:hypothetical protein
MKLPINYDKAHWTERKAAREEYRVLQDDKCWYCGSPLEGVPDKAIAVMRVNRKLFPKQFFKWPIHLHHNHNTGMTLGAVHNHCNAVLWQYYGE